MDGVPGSEKKKARYLILLGNSAGTPETVYGSICSVAGHSSAAKHSTRKKNACPQGIHVAQFRPFSRRKVIVAHCELFLRHSFRRGLPSVLITSNPVEYHQTCITSLSHSAYAGCQLLAINVNVKLSRCYHVGSVAFPASNDAVAC